MTNIMYSDLINGKFKVLNCIYSDRYIDILICKNITDNYKYIFNCIKDKSNYEIQIKSILEYYEQNSKVLDESRGFIHFVEAHVLIIGFKYGEGQKLEYCLQNRNYTYEDIFKIIENILISIQVIKIPEELKAYAYDIDSIYIDSNDEVSFNIALIEKYSENIIYQNEQRMIGDLIEKILSVANDNNDLNKILNVIKEKCKRELYESIPELIYEIKSTFANFEKAKDTRIINKEKLQLLFKKVFKIIGVLAISVTLIYFGYKYIYVKNIETFNQDYIKKIGDISIADEFKVKSDTDKEEDLLVVKEINLEEDKNIKSDEKEINLDLYSDNDTADASTEMDKEILDNNDEIVETDGEEKYDLYVVKEGEYLYKIIRDYYGNDDFVEEIIEFNKLEEPNNLKPGDTLKLPKDTDN